MRFRDLAVALATALALHLCATTMAHAIKIKTEKLPDGGHVESVYDDDGNWQSSHFYDEDNVHQTSVYADSTPSDDDSSGGGGPPTDTDVMEQLAKQAGGSLEREIDPWSTPIGLGLVESGKSGTIIPVHNPADGLSNEHDGYGGGFGGGIDLNGGGVSDFINKKKSSGGGGSGDDDDGDDGSSGGGGGGTDEDELLSVNPEIVNPPPAGNARVKIGKKGSNRMMRR